MSSSRWLPIALAVTLVAARVAAQSPEATPPALARGLDLEGAGKWREAAQAFREALPQAPVSAVLGLERVYGQLGWPDSLAPVLNALVAQKPGEAAFRTVQLRVLLAAGRPEGAAAAFESWLAASGRGPMPYREYARILLDEGRTAAADTVLRRAQQALGSGRDFAAELGQLRAAMGLWELSAASWREAVAGESFLHDAALFALAPTPAATRARVLDVFLAPPVLVPARRVAASLALHWNSPRDAWKALAALPPDDSSAAAWLEFADRAEASGYWLVARDALSAALSYKFLPGTAARAARDALAGDDFPGALALGERAARGLDSAEAARTVLPVRVQALAALGRAEEAERLVRVNAALLDGDMRGRLQGMLARGWVRAGNLPRARAALTGADDDEALGVAGWIALYEGDLAAARKALRHADERTPEAVLALALLSRTRADSSVPAGQAFLALARGDTATAVRRMLDASLTLVDAAPLLLGEAARLQARSDVRGAMTTWQSLVERYPTSPEAAEAELEWARSLRRAGRPADALAHLEHLILTHPDSALLPQARREMDSLRSSTP